MTGKQHNSSSGTTSKKYDSLKSRNLNTTAIQSANKIIEAKNSGNSNTISNSTQGKKK